MAASTVFVSNFPFATTEEELRARFEELSAVRSVRIIVDRETGRSRGFAFVELIDPGAIDGVVEALDGSEIKGRRLAVSRARGRAAAGDAPPRQAGGGGRSTSGGFTTGLGLREPFRQRIVIDWVEESGAYSASVPALGVSAQGASIDAALRAVLEGVEREGAAPDATEEES